MKEEAYNEISPDLKLYKNMDIQYFIEMIEKKEISLGRLSLYDDKFEILPGKTMFQTQYGSSIPYCETKNMEGEVVEGKELGPSNEDAIYLYSMSDNKPSGEMAKTFGQICWSTTVSKFKSEIENSLPILKKLSDADKKAMWRAGNVVGLKKSSL